MTLDELKIQMTSYETANRLSQVDIVNAILILIEEIEAIKLRLDVLETPP